MPLSSRHARTIPRPSDHPTYAPQESAMGVIGLLVALILLVILLRLIA
jgi:hypothetical protein